MFYVALFVVVVARRITRGHSFTHVPEASDSQDGDRGSFELKSAVWIFTCSLDACSAL